jgi:hypothetical protein
MHARAKRAMPPVALGTELNRINLEVGTRPPSRVLACPRSFRGSNPLWRRKANYWHMIARPTEDIA